jgi:type II secretory pathway component PulF
MLTIPVVGPLARELDISRFARTLSTLLDAGVDAASLIELTTGVIHMTASKNAVADSAEKVLQGRELSTALAPTRQFDTEVISILQAGEETGRLPESLNHLADDYEEQVSVMIKSLGNLIQPPVTVCLGVIALFIILAVFLPLIQMITSLAAP